MGESGAGGGIKQSARDFQEQGRSILHQVITLAPRPLANVSSLRMLHRYGLFIVPHFHPSILPHSPAPRNI
ncbi:MAG: hypothetical protein M3Y56_00280 [Armatimonadota bacterium]|nr:hypothetical protein [Armatimonadota bacterium]